MSKSKVVLIRCQTYNDGEVYVSVKKGIDLLGGVDRFVRPGEKILLKPNVLIGSEPNAAVTTHPSVMKAAGKVLHDTGAALFYGDSPAFTKTDTSLRKSGLDLAANDTGIIPADFEKGREVSYKKGILIKKFTLCNGVLDTDGLVSLSKLKTHGLMRFTGAVKNQFGCIPGLLKSQFHVKLPDAYRFAAMLVDLNMLIKPRLFIMDGITAMEGNGPRNGRPRNLNVLLFSTDPVALDATACRIINMNPEFVPTETVGEKAGLGTYRSEDIELVGDTLESFFTPDFDIKRSPPERQSGNWLMNFAKNLITSKPVIAESCCTRCGTCVEVCPLEPKGVNWCDDNRSFSPRHDYNRCIRCYCCQELCPEGAISLSTPLLGRIFFKY